MAITAKDVQTLREMTGVGMMDCKKALTEAEGNMDKAVELLREKGLAASQKKAGRIAAEVNFLNADFSHQFRLLSYCRIWGYGKPHTTKRCYCFSGMILDRST